MVQQCIGTFGLAFDVTRQLFVTSQLTGGLFVFPQGGGTAESAPRLGVALGPSAYDLTFGTDGQLYGVRPLTNGSFSAGAVVQLDPKTGIIARTLTQSLSTPTWIATNPQTGDLFVTNGGSGSLFSPNLWRIHNPSGKDSPPTVSVYTSDPSGFVQLVFAPDGTLYAMARDGRVLSYPGNSSAEPVPSTLLVKTAGGVGLALGPLGTNGAPSTITVSGGGAVSRVNVADGAVTPLVTGAFNLIEEKVGADRCLYLPDGTTVLKVTNSDGSCNWTPTPGPA